MEKFSDDVGLDVEETNESNEALKKAQIKDAEKEEQPEPVSVDGKLIRFAGPAVPVGPDGKPLPRYDPDEDPTNPQKLNIEHIVETDGLDVYKDQAGRLWTGLATYWIKRGEFDRARDIFEKGIKSVLTIRDFTQIFDAYTEFCESLISAMMEGVDDEDEDDDEGGMEGELDSRMKDFEELMDRRPFLVNEVLIRRNQNDVQEWEKRVALWGNDDDKVRGPILCCMDERSCFLVRSWRHITAHWKPSTLERLRLICTVYTSTLRNSMKKVAPKGRLSLT